MVLKLAVARCSLGRSFMEFWSILWLSVRVTCVAVFVSSLLGIPVGVWLGLSPFRGKAIVVAIVRTGMAMPPVVIGLLLYMLLSRSGPLAVLEWLFTPQAMILAQTILALPF